MARKKLEAALRQAQARLEHVVTSNPAILFTLAVADEQVQGIGWISDNVRQILGYTPEEALGADWWSTHIHPDDREAVARAVQTDLFAASQTANEFRFKHAAGHYRWTKGRFRLIRDQDGRSTEVVGVWLDITDRKHAEQEQSKLRKQLQQAQKLESVARLAGGAAHDFNNLLTVINGYSDILLNNIRPEDPLREFVSEIRLAGERAAMLSQQFLVLSRKQIVQPAELNLNDIIAEVGRMLERVIGEDIRIKYSLDSNLGAVLADAGQIHQVLMNLAVNARDAMPAGGTLLVETANVELTESYTDSHIDVTPGAYVRLKVSDTGVGMDAEVQSHLFEPFFTTKAPGEGTGLGLATVYGIVKQSRGSISVYSEPGEGSVFSIHLPRVRRGLVAAPAAASATPLPIVRGSETVLVVEDHEQVRGIAVRVLRELGYMVLEAPGPEQALTQCEGYDGPIHLLLTDVNMPGMRARELADRIVRTRPSTKVIYMSAYSEPAIHDRGVLPQSVNFLQKPFSPQELSSKIREVLGPPGPAGVVLVVDDEPGVRSFLRKILSGAGFEVMEADGGRSAAAQVRERAVDLVLVDLSMPEQDGFETIKMLRREQPDIRIIAMSGRFPKLLGAAELLGADAAIAKPISPDKLFPIIQRVLEKPQ